VIVIDASALVDLLLNRPTAAGTTAALAGRRSLHAPHLIHTEVLHALRRWVGRGDLGGARAETALGDLRDLPLVPHGHAPLTERVWALRERLSAYDATYVALAEALDATLITADGRLARAARPLVPIVHAS